MWMKPRKLKVSGLPCPRLFRFRVAKRPNSIRRVFSELSSSPNFASRSRNCARNRSASYRCWKPRTSSSAADDDDIARRFLPPPLVHPDVEDIMQVEICQDRRNHRPLRSPFLCLGPPSLLHHARFQPFLDQADDPLISHSVLHKLDHPNMIDSVEECPDVKI